MNAQTTLSAKGQVVIPKNVRDRLRLLPGDQLEVVERDDGVLLRRPQRLPKSGRSADEIFNRIREIAPKWEGPPVTDEAMKAGIDRMFRETWEQ